MLMFNSGLMSTFIPEILMVLGYLFCFISPNLNREKTAIEARQIDTLVENQQNNAVLTTCHFTDFVTIECLISEKKETNLFSKTQLKFHFENLNPVLPDEFDFEQFSRPPPTFC